MLARFFGLMDIHSKSLLRRFWVNDLIWFQRRLSDCLAFLTVFGRETCVCGQTVFTWIEQMESTTCGPVVDEDFGQALEVEHSGRPSSKAYRILRTAVLATVALDIRVRDLIERMA